MLPMFYTTLWPPVLTLASLLALRLPKDVILALLKLLSVRYCYPHAYQPQGLCLCLPCATSCSNVTYPEQH